MSERESSRRDVLLGFGSVVTVGALAGCSGTKVGSSPADTAGEFSPTFALQTLEAPKTYDPLDTSLRFDVVSDAEISTLDVEITDPTGETTSTTATDFDGDTVEFADEYRPQLAGTHTLSVRATHQDKFETWEQPVEVVWKTPDDLLFDEQFRKLLDTLDNPGQFMQTLTTTEGYTDRGERVATMFTDLMNTDQSAAVSLAPTLSEYGKQLTTKDVAFLEAFTDSTDQYRSHLKQYGLTESQEYDAIRTFERELYGLDSVLAGRTHFDDDENPDIQRQRLVADLVEMRDNILAEKGHFDQRDITYLQTVSALISERKIARNPRYEQLQARDNWTAPTEDGQISAEAIEQLETVRATWEANSANDLIRDVVKKHVLSVAVDIDVVLLEVGYTEAVDYSRRKRLMTDVIDYMAREYDIYIIAIEGETDKESFNGQSDWTSSTAERVETLEKLGMHQLYFDEEALPDAAGRAYLSNGASRGLVETTHKEGYVDYSLKHEMGHMFGLWSEKYGWVHAGCNSDQSESYMTYCSDLPAETFTEKDLAGMREQQFEQDGMSMARLEQMVIEGTTLYDEFETIYTPESLSIESL